MQCWQRNAAATLLGSRVAARLRAACAAACNPRSLAARPARPLCARAQQPRARRPAAAAVAAGTAGHCAPWPGGRGLLWQQGLAHARAPRARRLLRPGRLGQRGEHGGHALVHVQQLVAQRLAQELE